MLGRNYEIEGIVVKGAARGKELGFPTANIQSENEITPQGVFLTTAELQQKKYLSLTNIGTHPTFDQKGIQIESYLIDFQGNLYGKKIRLHFIKKIRDERKFKNTKALSLQIEKDLEVARSSFHL
jgi:riboflavin kinase/FMN adenylyltransferase